MHLLMKPKTISHCNPRTNYLYVEHEFNPDDCIFCHELAMLLFESWSKTDE